MNKLFKLLIAGAFVSTSIATAQDLKYCGTTEAMNKAFAENPAMHQQYLQMQAELKTKDLEAFKNGYQNKQGGTPAPMYVIPVVFHILHLNGAENISDAQIQDQMRILNEDFRKLNADNANTVAAFQGISADTEIEFRLAKKDPNGNCTNGIDRIYSTETNVGDNGSKLNTWPRSKYLNVWVVKAISSGAAGYFSGWFNAAEDGIMILNSYIGSIGTGNIQKSHALTHEIGHYLNLSHVWGDTNNPGVDCTGDDNVSDTPPTEGWTTCNLTGSTCGSPIDNVQNFMEYSYCSTMFTTGQKNRMHDLLTATTGFDGFSERYKLYTTTNLAATGVSTPAVLCQADFISNSNTSVICAGDSVTYTDVSWNGTPLSWSWTFPGGTPASSTLATPTITYNTPGVYSASLTVTDASGSKSTTKNNYIVVNNNTAQYTNTFYSEGFETTAIPNTDWDVRNTNSGSNTWEQTTTAAATGSKCVRLMNNTNYVGHIDELISPSIDMTQLSDTTPNLTFKIAHAQKTSTSADKLQVYISTNCGKTWVLRQTTTGSALSSAGIVAGSFVPTASQWITKTVNLTGYITQTNLYIMFRFTSDGGNNIYLDDINIDAATVGIEDEVANNLNFNVYPNPATENTVIDFTLLSKQAVDLKVLDVIGREVSTIVNSNLNSGDYKFNVNEQAKLSAGVYFIKLNVGNRVFTKKLIIE
jgi:PKD repeat protein